MKIARIDKRTGIVLNLEVCDPEWLEEDDQVNSEDFLFIADDNDKATIGHIWDGVTYLVPSK